MKNLIGRIMAVFAVVSAAALTSPLAAAQENTVTLEGLVWFDRNANGVVDEGEPPLAGGRGVRVFNGKEFIGEYGTDANGRYKVEGLLNTQLSIFSHNTDVYEATTTSSFFPTGGGTFDFGIRGGTVRGFSFVDFDKDGTRQTHESDVPAPSTLRLVTDCVDDPVGVGCVDGVDVAPPTRGVNGEYAFNDVPLGLQSLVVADRRPELKLAQPLTEYDVDPESRRKGVVVRVGETTRADVRYVPLDIDFVVGEPRVEPAKDAYRIGDEVTMTVSVTNRGEAADKATFVMFGSTPHFVAASDALVVRHPGQDFELRDMLEVGQTVEFSLTYRLDNPEFDRFHLFARPVSVLNRRDVNTRDNHAIVLLEYLPAEPTTTPPTDTTTTTAPTSTTTATTTTTNVAMVQAGGSGLASTGATPLPFLAIGVLLLVGGGALTFLAARRRRRA
ncbi:hypothetical protein ALI22I_39790 [Saccharothrix sp. ALI-22-I]|uniref:hypothetical protein n=1 Tax=Saccharothrix sp. ALI-22-I TaxID=1933778 RepID=UPI00097C5049|nr:hypothetical protein [Saccharothrix sp. ALI-22-I]ONI82271.1 hypothetical protein ALI22I_39790 [Saccharothrix sp. ALI-22-I]